MDYAYTPQIWPSLLTVLFLLAMAFYSYRRRKVPGALPFAIALLFVVLWMVGSTLEVAAVDVSAKIFWVKFQNALMLPSVTAVTCFLLEYTWPGRWLTRRNLVLLSIPPLSILGLILTDKFHHLMWRGFVLNENLVPLRAAGSWMLVACLYGLSIVNIVVLGWLFHRSPQHRWPVVLILAGQIAARIVYGMEAVQVIQSDLDIEIIAFWFTIPMYVIALFGFRILNPIPLARQTVIEQLRDGMLVLDSRGWVVSLNPAAEIILDAPIKHMQGKPIGELLPGFPEQGSPLTAEAFPVKLPEMNISLRGIAHCYELDFSPLLDFRGLPIGHLLLLHDVSEQRRSQAQLLEQQRAMAILTERERLARELHDDLGQVLAFISTQGYVIQQQLARGEITAAGSYMTRLIEAATEADTDIRESILSLRAPFSGQGLIPALQDYLRRYEQRYGLQTELLPPPANLECAFDPVAEVQILRILQEGLSNVRKHAHARCVKVAFTALDKKIQIAIRDDGKGFEPSMLQEDQSSGFGLRFMRERADAIGSSLKVHSAPGEGTEILLTVPMKECDA